MYYVYFGHITEDNDIEDISHRLTCFLTEEEVLQFHDVWLNKPHKHCYDCKFRVVRGTEFSLKPKEYVSKWTLHDPALDTAENKNDWFIHKAVSDNKFAPTLGSSSIGVTLTTINEGLGCGDFKPLSSGDVFKP